MTKKKKAILFSILGLILLLGIIFGVFSWISYMNREPFPIEMPETGYKYVRAEIGSNPRDYGVDEKNVDYGWEFAYVDLSKDDYTPIIKALNKIREVKPSKSTKEAFEYAIAMGGVDDKLNICVDDRYLVSIILRNSDLYKDGGQKAIYVEFTDKNTGYDAEYKYYGPINDNSPLSSKSIYKMLEKYKMNK